MHHVRPKRRSEIVYLDDGALHQIPISLNKIAYNASINNKRNARNLSRLPIDAILTKFIIPFNGDSSGHPEWDKDLNLREAFELSSEPFFKEVARRIGKENLQHFLDTVRYGNKTIGDSVTSCWTDNSLKISADEQVGFLRKMYFNQLPFTDRTQRIVRSLMLHDNKNGQKLYYKTGWGKNDSAAILWVVGFAEYEVKIKEKEGSMNKSGERNYVYFFAQNFELPQAETDQNKWSAQRIDLLQKVLSHHVSQSQQAQ